MEIDFSEEFSIFYMVVKRRFSQEAHGVIFQKIVFFIVTAVRSLNLTNQLTY
jgi:hypothetical protein